VSTQQEREGFYVDAVHAEWERRMEAKVIAAPREHSEALAKAAMAVADAEQAALVAEVERWQRVAEIKHTTTQEANARADKAEAEVRDLRAKVAAVQALADEWDRQKHVMRHALRAALASVGRTEPAPEAQPKHDEGCPEWCNHCQWCGEGIPYGSQCTECVAAQTAGRTEPEGAE
jgi:hypothetical protein